jgi:hypothetical protein
MGTIVRQRQSPSQPIPPPIVTASPPPSATTPESGKSHKVLIGRSLRARTQPAQKVEARIACKVINRMTSLGMPLSRKVA